MSDTFESLIKKGRPYLKAYLEEMGVEFGKSGLFSCVHPDHDDSNPSTGIIPNSNGEQFHCFSCGFSGDIYTAAYALEGYPPFGPGFLTENLYKVLDKFGIEHEELVLTEAQLTEIKYNKLHQAVIDTMLQKNKEGDFVHLDLSHAKTDRGWTAEICTKLCIGTIKDYDQFINTIRIKSGFSTDNIQEMGITRKLFGPEYITFTVRNSKGIVRGFVARYLAWEKDCGHDKYHNTSAVHNPLYRKGSLLYGMENARKITGLRLDVFEGYGSYVTALQEQYRNCVALGGTAFTEDHARLIFALGFKHINLVLDNDSTGIGYSDAYIEKFSGYCGLKVTITNLPFSEEDCATPGHNDPDYFIATYGIHAYRKVKPIGAFEHMVAKTVGQFEPGTEEAVAFAKETVRLIINEEDLIERGNKVRILSNHTGVDKEDLKDEIYRIENSDVSVITQDLQARLSSVRTADQLHEIMSSANIRLEDSGTGKKDRYLRSLGESLEAWDEIFVEMNNQTEGIHGWKTGYEPLDDMLDGIARPGKGGVAYGLAGAPQHGKSAAMLNIGLQVALNNTDASILYWAIDDNRKAIAYRLTSMISEVTMKKVRNIHPSSDDEKKRIRDAQDLLMTLTSEKRLIFKDDRFGRSTAKAEKWIQEVQDSEGRDVLFCVDSLHNIQSPIEGDQRVKLIANSTWLKGLCAKMPLSAMATMELVKNRGDIKPTLTSISESGKMEFDFDAVAITWMEAQGKYEAVANAYAKWGEAPFYKPIIELDWQKNKSAAGEKGPVYFKYEPTTTKFVDCTSKLDGLVVSSPVVIRDGDSKLSVSSSRDGGLVPTKPRRFVLGDR